MLKHANDNDFVEVLKCSASVTLVDFFATWCGPCQVLAPVLDKISSSRADFDIIKVDVDKSQNLAQEYAIEVVPTLIVFKNSKKVEQIEGALQEEELLEFVQKYID